MEVKIVFKMRAEASLGGFLSIYTIDRDLTFSSAGKRLINELTHKLADKLF